MRVSLFLMRLYNPIDPGRRMPLKMYKCGFREVEVLQEVVPNTFDEDVEWARMSIDQIAICVSW
jgi:hypothetical protein